MTRATLPTNVAAFLDMIAHSEIGAAQLAATDDGYNVLVGSTAAHPILFDSYAKHPHVLNREFDSTAAGRYQIIFPTWSGIVRNMRSEAPRDFSPASQDIGAVELLKECGAHKAIVASDFDGAMQRAARLWASLPGSTAGQHINKRAALLAVYIQAGGATA